MNQTNTEALLRAVAEGDEPAVVDAVETGTSLELEDESGRSLLAIAIIHEQHGVTKILLRNGASCWASGILGENPLHLALRGRGGEALIFRLLEAGCDPNEPDRFGMTPLDVERESGSSALSEVLLAIDEQNILWECSRPLEQAETEKARDRSRGAAYNPSA